MPPVFSPPHTIGVAVSTLPRPGALAGAQGADECAGLRWLDREVIRALLSQPKSRTGTGGSPQFVCYAASEHNVCMLAGVDKEEYRETIRPRLMSRGLLEVRPYYGQALTDLAVSTYSPG